MSTKKISELNEITELNENDLFPVVDTQNDITKKVKFKNVIGETTSWTTLNSTYNCKYRKTRKNVEININTSFSTLQTLAAFADTTIGTLPEGYRPSILTRNLIFVRNSAGDTFSRVLISVNTNGAVTLFNWGNQLSNVQAVVGCISYFI